MKDDHHIIWVKPPFNYKLYIYIIYKYQTIYQTIIIVTTIVIHRFFTCIDAVLRFAASPGIPHIDTWWQSERCNYGATQHPAVWNVAVWHRGRAGPGRAIMHGIGLDKLASDNEHSAGQLQEELQAGDFLRPGT